MNIHPDIMNSGLKENLIAIPSVIGLEPTYFTEKSGKWLLLVKKSQKDNARIAIDQIINDTIFPDSQVTKPGRENRHNINASLVTYVDTFQKTNTPSTIQFHHPPQNTVKGNIRASYGINQLDSFPNLNKK